MTNFLNVINVAAKQATRNVIVSFHEIAERQPCISTFSTRCRLFDVSSYVVFNVVFLMSFFSNVVSDVVYQEFFPMKSSKESLGTKEKIVPKRLKRRKSWKM